MVDNLEHVENQIAKLESLVGKFEKLEQIKGLETILEISTKLNENIGKNPKMIAAVKSLNDIKKYTSFQMLNEADEERLLTAKMEWILMEEDNLKRLNEDFAKFKQLANILNDKALNNVPELLQRLRELSSKQGQLKEKQAVFYDELKDFLSIYTNTINSINASMTGLSGYLDQFDKANRYTTEPYESEA